MIELFQDQLVGDGVDYLLSQLFAAISLLLVIVGFIQKHDTRFKWLMLMSCVTMGPHFYFLSAWGGFITNFVVLIRYAAALRWPGSRTAFAVLAIAGATLVLLFYKDPRDILVIAANVFGCVAVFLNSGMAMRKWFLPTAMCWLVYNALNLSVVGVVFEAFSLAANQVGMLRMRRAVAEPSRAPL